MRGTDLGPAKPGFRGGAGESAGRLLGTWLRWRARRCRDRSVRPFRNPLIGTIVLSAGDAVRLAKFRIAGIAPASSPVFADREELLDVSIEHAHGEGLFLEFGVAAGTSINYIADRTPNPVFGFDSFEGLPARWKPFVPAGAYSVRGHLPTVRPQVTLIRGFFRQTVPPFLSARPDERIAFVHIDCDLYSSTCDALDCLAARVGIGTVIVFDEFCTIMPDDECRAWKEFCRALEIKYEFLGMSVAGSVAVQVTEARGGLRGV